MTYLILERGVGRKILWGNGLGISEEIYARYASDADRTMLWRLSTTSIMQTGPFSNYSGYRRTIALLSGEGFELSFVEYGRRHRVDKRCDPYSFCGSWNTMCNLMAGQADVLNFMALDEHVNYVVRPLSRSDHPHLIAGAQTVIIHNLHGGCSISAHTPDADCHLGDGQTFILDAEGAGVEVSLAADQAMALAFSISLRL